MRLADSTIQDGLLAGDVSVNTTLAAFVLGKSAEQQRELDERFPNKEIPQEELFDFCHILNKHGVTKTLHVKAIEAIPPTQFHPTRYVEHSDVWYTIRTKSGYCVLDNVISQT